MAALDPYRATPDTLQHTRRGVDNRPAWMLSTPAAASPHEETAPEADAYDPAAPTAAYDVSLAEPMATYDAAIAPPAATYDAAPASDTGYDPAWPLYGGGLPVPGAPPPAVGQQTVPRGTDAGPAAPRAVSGGEDTRLRDMFDAWFSGVAQPGVPAELAAAARITVAWDPIHAFTRFAWGAPPMDFGALLQHASTDWGVAVWMAPGELPGKTQRRKHQVRPCPTPTGAPPCCRNHLAAQWTVVHAIDVPVAGVSAAGRGAKRCNTAASLRGLTLQAAPHETGRNGHPVMAPLWNVLNDRGQLVGVTGTHAIMLPCQ